MRRDVADADGRGPDRQRAWEIYGKSIPRLFRERAEGAPGGVAFRFKTLGIYEEVTWARYRERVEDFCLGLIALGLQRGDRVAIMGDPCPEWFIGDMATLCAGGVSYGIYTTCSIAEVHYQLEHGGATIFIAEDQEYVDKVLAVIDRLPALRRVVVADMRAMFLYKDERILSVAAVEALGRERKGRDPDLFHGRIAETRAEDIAVLVYTSGTTGPPKAAMLTHRDLMIGMVWPYLEGYPELTRGTHRIITHLALAHLVERSASLCLPLIADVIPHIGEDVENLRETLFEVQPTFFHAVPRIWEKLASNMLVGVQMSSPLKRLAFRWAMAVGRRHRQDWWRHGRVAVLWALLCRLAYLCVFRPLLRRAGLSRARSALTAGAPIPEHVQALWQIWGVNLRNLYGITEGTLVLCQRGDFPRPGDAGVPLFPKDVRLDEDGEILVGGPGLFAGYWGNEAATRDVMRDGWFHTGDVAERTASGLYRIVDRKKDIMVTAGGKNITPSEIENLLKSSPFVSEAVVFADGRKYVTALIEIDFDTVSEWAREKKVLYTGFTSLALHPRTYDLISGEVARANEQLGRVEQVKKFRILPKELDPEEGDTTPTRKIKRRHLYDMFRDLVEEMYSAEEEALIAAELKNARVAG